MHQINGWAIRITTILPSNNADTGPATSPPVTECMYAVGVVRAAAHGHSQPGSTAAVSAVANRSPAAQIALQGCTTFYKPQQILEKCSQLWDLLWHGCCASSQPLWLVFQQHNFHYMEITFVLAALGNHTTHKGNCFPKESVLIQENSIHDSHHLQG